MEAKMRILTSLLLLLISIFVAAQDKDELKPKDKWHRVYTYEDSVVEMNAAKVILVNNDIGRVTFRTVYSKQQNIKEKPGVKFKTRLETVEYKCAERRFRIYQVTLLDSKGKAAYSYEMDQNEAWKSAKPDGIMERLMGFGCRLIVEKRATKEPSETTEPILRPVLRRRP